MARVAQSELGTEHWVVSNWSEKDLDHPLPESEAGLDVVDAGVRVTTFDRRGQAHVIHRRELLDEFEIKVRIVQPSVEELIAEGMPRPSVFSIHDFKVTPPEDEPTGGDLGAPTRAQPTVMPPATRVWTDAGGTRQITATFVKLEGDKAHLRRDDGENFAVSLDALSADDREIARRLASPEGSGGVRQFNAAAGLVGSRCC